VENASLPRLFFYIEQFNIVVVFHVIMIIKRSKKWKQRTWQLEGVFWGGFWDSEYVRRV